MASTSNRAVAAGQSDRQMTSMQQTEIKNFRPSLHTVINPAGKRCQDSLSKTTTMRYIEIALSLSTMSIQNIQRCNWSHPTLISGFCELIIGHSSTHRLQIGTSQQHESIRLENAVELRQGNWNFMGIQMLNIVRGEHHRHPPPLSYRSLCRSSGAPWNQYLSESPILVNKRCTVFVFGPTANVKKNGVVESEAAAVFTAIRVEAPIRRMAVLNHQKTPVCQGRFEQGESTPHGVSGGGFQGAHKSFPRQLHLLQNRELLARNAKAAGMGITWAVELKSLLPAKLPNGDTRRWPMPGRKFLVVDRAINQKPGR